MKLLRKFLAPILHIKAVYLIGMLTISFWFIFDLITVRSLKLVADGVETENTGLIYKVMSIYAVLLILFYGVKFLTRKLGWARSRYELAKYFSKFYQSKFFNLDFTYVEKYGVGRIISIIEEGINNWIDGLAELQYMIPNVIIKLGFTLFLLSQIGREYIILFLCLFIGVQFYVLWINRSYVAPMRKVRKEYAIKRSRQFVRMIMSKQEIIQSDKINIEIDNYQDSVQHQQDINYGITKFIYFMFKVPLIIVQSLGVVVMRYAYSSLSAGTFSLGFFTALVAMIGYLTQLMLQATDIFKKVSDQLIHVEKMRDFFDKGTFIQDELHIGNTFTYDTGKIQAKDIGFSYNDGEKVFDNFSIDLTGGKKTALVGVSGSGKSTLVKLIAGYLRPDSGAVLIDGQDLHNIALKSYYSHIGYLTQEPSVFDGTVRDNLTYAIQQDQENLKEKVQQAIVDANCEFLLELKQGLQTEIGERGVRLSGGQRQRLAIAKIFLKDPKILILDEPTSALDSFSEEAITKAMHKLFEGRTVIIIAHRLQTVKQADDIVLLEEGKIVERGTHDELVALGGKYAKMLELQSGF